MTTMEEINIYILGGLIGGIIIVTFMLSVLLYFTNDDL